MANYVLVHGGHGGGNSGSVWDKVVALLENRGHKAFAPTLSASDTCSLEDHISEVCSLIENRQLGDVMLAGHAKQDNWDYFELQSDHLCMVSHPEELAAILLQEAG